MSIIGAFCPRGWFEITPDDQNDLPQNAFGVYCGEEGTVEVVDVKGNTTTWSVTQHFIIPAVIVRVNSADISDIKGGIL